MSLTELKPEELPVELRYKVEKVMREEHLSWDGALVFLALKVVSPD